MMNKEMLHLNEKEYRFVAKNVRTYFGVKKVRWNSDQINWAITNNLIF